MKKILLLMVFSLSTLMVKADEGMWLMMLIKRLENVDLQKQGLKLTPEEIYSVNHSSLKDAIVQFNGGCTAEVVSKKGLLFTNHHCGYNAIAELSTPEHNYLKDGFWAKNHQEELKYENLYVRFLVRMDDATSRILGKLNDSMTSEQRQLAIDAEMKLIEQENNQNGKYTVVVKSFFNGNEFYYFVYQDYTDIRLVATPPENIGKFGGDTDNWEWPRHTGDFSVFRIYADKNNQPAKYSADNVPFSPQHALPISIAGVQKDDYTMIVGYPGRTNRYLTSYGITQLISNDYPAYVQASKMAMDIMKTHMDKSTQVRLDYAGAYAGIANYWKNRQGTIDAVIKNGSIAEKRNLESKYRSWSLRPENENTYSGVLENIEVYYKQISKRNVERNYNSIMARTAKFLTIPSRLGSLLKTYAEQDENGKKAMKQKVTDAVNQSYKGFNTVIEAELLSNLVNLYKTKADISIQALSMKNETPTGIVKKAYASIFVSKDKIMEFVNNPIQYKLMTDELYKTSIQYVEDQKTIVKRFKLVDDNFEVLSRKFLSGLMKSQPEKNFFPDANSTMRLTYGKVEALPVNPAKQYYGISAEENYVTDLDGAVMKYKPNDAEFDMPKELVALNKAKNYGRYADAKGRLIVNFLSNNDITGGNSGSPIMNGKGELIGLAFDGNSEALSGDIVFEPKLQRTINLDVRYLLFLMDKYAGASNLIQELDIRN